MEEIQVRETRPRSVSLFLRQFNWRMLLVRILINGISLLVTALIVPAIYFVNPSLVNLLFLAVILGLLNALVKPILQFLTLALIFVTYGLVIVLINTAILILLSRLFPNLFAVDRLLWAFSGGAVMGILSGFLESLFGLNLPILWDTDRRQEGAGTAALPAAGVQRRMEGVPAADTALPEATRGMESLAILEATDAALARAPGDSAAQAAEDEQELLFEHPSGAGEGEGDEQP